MQIEAARRAFYEGFVAETIAGYLDTAEVMDVTGHRHRGLLSAADLAAWRASTERPVTLDFRGLTVCKTGPWGQGPVFLQQLALLDGLGIDDMQPGSAAVRAHGGRGVQARLRRPGSVVRRPAVRRGATGGAAVTRVLGRSGGGSSASRRPASCGPARPAEPQPRLPQFAAGRRSAPAVRPPGRASRP